ncbi:MAG: hypothetical protein LUC27_00835 [Lachnospiraceae bacterium]|nr:hypothetical protein [Lachnospiraceae bacterium]
MKKTPFPWESLNGPVYPARELKPRKKWVTAGGWILSVLLILGGLITRFRIAALFGILYVLTLLMQRDIVVSERGVETFHQMRITTHYELWRWQEIDGIAQESVEHPELTTLYFSRGDRVKKLYFTRSEAKDILALARTCHPGIPIDTSWASSKKSVR